MTADSAPRPSLRRRLREHTRSVRASITAWFVVLLTVALAVVGATIYLLATNSVDQRITASISQEMREFEQLQQQGIDPATGEPFRSADRLVEVALQRNSPLRNEVLIGFVSSGPPLITQESEALDQVDRAALSTVVDRSLPEGGFERLETDAGELLIAVKPVSGGGSDAAYVAGYFRDLEQAGVQGIMRMYMLVAGLVLVLVAFGAWLTAGRLLRPIRELRDTANDITETDLSRRLDVTRKDDLADLAHTFNAMLDRLEDSFGLQRRFLDDAGHELRTPITIVRGHLEVADTGNAEDMEATRALVLDELDRMGRLVDDLIVLAKAGQPDFVRVTAVDAGVLTDHVLEKVSALGDRDWRVDQRVDAIVEADPQRVTQALVQLAKNAVQHTRPGDEIAIGSAVHNGMVGWWVRDTGPGVQRADAERIFDRFQRGHQARGHDGSGLGLSIVRAIANAHGGDVLLHSTPGEGAVFTVTVPLRRARNHVEVP